MPHPVTTVIDNIIDAAPEYSMENYLQDKGLSGSPLLRKLMSDEETREALGGISRMTLHRLRKARLLTSVRIKSRVFFDPKDVETFIENQKDCH
jgi:hypothetical protein